MRGIFIILILQICGSPLTHAQTFYNVNVDTGNQIFGVDTVHITPIGDATIWGGYCNVYLPYHIGYSTPGSYLFSFSKPAKAFKFRCGAMNKGEVISIYVNGVHYSVLPQTIDTFFTGCFVSIPKAIVSNGDLICPSTTNTCEQKVTIKPGNPINTVEIAQTGLLNGTIFDFYFSYDYSYITIPTSFPSTAVCAGKDLSVPFNVVPVFNPGNIFTAQLSDAFGGFTNPVNIGTKTSGVSGTIPCTIPANTSPGTNYRIRIISSNPPDTSANDSANITIYQNPQPVITSGGSVCEGTEFSLNVSSLTPVLSYTWTKPGGGAPVQSPSLFFSNATMSLAGDYIVEGDYYGCKGRDTITLVIKPKPPTPAITTSSPVCPEDTLFVSAALIPGVSYQWTGPNGFSSSAKDTLVGNFTVAQQGYYNVKSILNGCMSSPDSELAITGQVPVIRVSANNPVCSGQALTITARDTVAHSVKGLQYTWTGPGGYAAATQNISILNVDTNRTGRYFVTAVKGKCTDSAGIDITVFQTPPEPHVTSNSPLHAGEDLELKITDPQQGAGYNWIGPNNFTSTLLAPVIHNVTSQATGSYIATANRGPCLASAITIVVVDIINNAFIQLYPNPNNGKFKLKGLVSKEQVVPIWIYSTWGQLLQSDAVKTDNYRLETDISLPAVASGIYFLQLSVDEKNIQIPFVVKRE